MRFRIPLEFSVGILAALTLLLTLAPLNLPIYGIFVFWGATFLLGSPNLEGVKKMVPPAILGLSRSYYSSTLIQSQVQVCHLPR